MTKQLTYPDVIYVHAPDGDLDRLVVDAYGPLPVMNLGEIAYRRDVVVYPNWTGETYPRCNCGKRVWRNWNFCPACGEGLE